jgi:signal transduction histidine kinase
LVRQADHHVQVCTGSGEEAASPERFPETLANAEKAAEKKILGAAKSLRRSIALFSMVIIVATAILVEAVISAQRRSDLETARFESASLSAVFEEQIRRVVNSVSGGMEWLKSDIEAHGPDEGLVNWAARSDFAALPTQVIIIGPDGKVVVSPTNPNAHAIDMSDREYFRVHVGSRQRGLFIGKPIQARFSGNIRIPFSLRLEKADGKFDGVLEVSLDPEFLSSLYRSVDLGRTGTLTLLGTDGVVRAHFTAGRKPGTTEPSLVGSTLADVPALHDSEFQSEGAYEGKGADGVARMFHWRKVRGYPLIVTSGLGRTEALLASRYQEGLMLAVGGVALILAFFMPLLLYREISKRIANELDLNSEKIKLRHANDALAEERKNLRAMNEELLSEKQRAEAANNAKSVFLMNMSHEFRTPMHAILNYTNMGLKKIATEDWDKLEKYMRNTRSAGFRLLRMLNGLLDLAKLEAGKIELQTEESDLRKIIDETVFELSSLFEEKSLRVAVIADSKSVTAIFDPNRVIQVLVNLFSNAIKYSPAEGLIQVALAHSQLKDGRPGVQCTILDEGAGIPADELGKIFERFSQSSTTKKSGGGGSGLGLTICRELIELHGGNIWAFNRETGGGAVSFIIPKAPILMAAGAVEGVYAR